MTNIQTLLLDVRPKGVRSKKVCILTLLSDRVLVPLLGINPLFLSERKVDIHEDSELAGDKEGDRYGSLSGNSLEAGRNTEGQSPFS